MSKYKLLARGVLDNVTGRTVMPDEPKWETEYQPWVAAGGVPDPMDVHLPTADDVADETERVARRAVLGQLKLDAAVLALRNRTPAQVDAWIDANVNSLADARSVLKILARVVALLVRERL